MVTVRMPSGGVRLIHGACSATIGQVGNTQHELAKLGKAGRSVGWVWRHIIEAVSMNPVITRWVVVKVNLLVADIRFRHGVSLLRVIVREITSVLTE